MNQTSRRYSIIFYGCLLVTVVLVGVMLFSPAGDSTAALGTTTNTSLNQVRATTTATTTATTAQGNSSGLVDTSPTVPTTVNLRWSDAQIKDFMAEALKQADIAIEITQVALTEPNTIALAGSVGRDVIEKLLDAANIPSKEALKFALRLLPQTLDITVSFSAEAQDGSVVITPLTLTAQNVSLPTSLLPAGVMDTFNTTVRDTLAQEKCTLDSLMIADNTLYLTCTVS